MPPAMRSSNHPLLDLHRKLLLPFHCRTFFGRNGILAWCVLVDTDSVLRYSLISECALLLARPDSTRSSSPLCSLMCGKLAVQTGGGLTDPDFLKRASINHQFWQARRRWRWPTDFSDCVAVWPNNQVSYVLSHHLQAYGRSRCGLGGRLS